MRTREHTGRKRFTLLMAALWLASSALVTAHAFGAADHAVKDGCQVCHQFELQQHAPAGASLPPPDVRRHLQPRHEFPVAVVIDGVRHFQPRAPPLV